MMERVLMIHENDPNFPYSIIQRIRAFLGTYTDSVAMMSWNYLEIKLI